MVWCCGWCLSCSVFVFLLWETGQKRSVCMLSFSTVLCGAPPTVDNAFLIGRKHSHYDIHSIVRYQCADGFLQRHVPTAKCRANGKWDRPKIICIKCEFFTAGLSQSRQHDWKLHFQMSSVIFTFLFLACTPPPGPKDQTSYISSPQEPLSPCAFKLPIHALIINNCRHKDYCGCRLN